MILLHNTSEPCLSLPRRGRSLTIFKQHPSEPRPKSHEFWAAGAFTGGISMVLPRPRSWPVAGKGNTSHKGAATATSFPSVPYRLVRFVPGRLFLVGRSWSWPPSHEYFPGHPGHNHSHGRPPPFRSRWRAGPLHLLQANQTQIWTTLPSAHRQHLPPRGEALEILMVTPTTFSFSKRNWLLKSSYAGSWRPNCAVATNLSEHSRPNLPSGTTSGRIWSKFNAN
ncbi:hypothetical protein B0H14DRAFT_3877601 [Mycena olivaceomarginata]|nr:hypothetical protein B0H14DRAFT_3877601 [Mycena olivaceomarginata]